MQKQLQQSMFQPMKQLRTKNFSIELDKPMTLLDLAKISFPQIITDSQVKKNKEFHLYIFVFIIRYQDRQYKLYRRLIDFLAFQSVMKKRYGRQAPMLPIRKENQIKPQNINSLSDFLLVFLKKIVNIAFYDDDVQNFLQIMPNEKGSGVIYGQVPLKKRSGGRFTEGSLGRKCTQLLCCCRNWRTRHFTVTDQGIFYTAKKKSYQIKDMLPFSVKFQILAGKRDTGEQKGIEIHSSYRILELVAQNWYDLITFVHFVRQAYHQSPLKDIQRFHSFAGIRKNCDAKFYIDGQDYFSDLCQGLLKAKKQVFITDWMMTPYLLLKRPAQLDDRSSRFDYVLQTIASKGVKIYIIIYMEPKIALNNDSQFVQKYLQQLNPNIKVLRHPNFILIPFLWSHHQKMVVIDQKIAFLGGLDICYGRWDTQQHPLVQSPQKGPVNWKGAQFCNLRISDIYTPRNFLMSNLDHKTQPRLPWHDIGIRIKGSSVTDVNRHFVQYWNFVSFQTQFDERQLLIHAGRHSVIPQSPSFSIKTKNFVNEIFDINRTKREMLDKKQVNQEATESQVNADQAEFYKKYMKDNEKSRFKESLDKLKFQNIINYPKKIINFLKEGQMNQDEQVLLITEEASSKKGSQTHQILRSSSTWSLGLEQDSQEKSIYNAYLELIKNAQNYIYIQNQFFMGKQNKIVDTIAQRIDQAFQKKQMFKVIVFMPLLPAFQGEVDHDSAVVLRVQLHWEYYSICRSKKSLYSRLSHIPNIDEYLKFYSLRNHAVTEAKIPVTQIIYIHSKLMIVDDKYVIMGSANINDRSLLGDRDSQIAILVEDGQQIQVANRTVSKFAHQLRVQLYMQHFAMNRKQAQDFMDQKMWGLMQNRAHKNTQIYRSLFGCYPDDTILKYSDIARLKSNANPKLYQQVSKQIIGHAVQFPLKFLQKQKLNIAPNQKEFLMPQINFT